MNIIKKVLTALGETKINELLRKDKRYEVVGNDIPYQDGVIDILEGNSLIDILLLSETLIGEYDIKFFIYKIKKINPYIKIIFFMSSKNVELEIFLQSNGITDIYKDGENTIDEIINKLNPKEINIFDEVCEKSKVIAVAGNYNSGKSLITSLLALTYNMQNMKVLIIDFDIFNKSQEKLFGIHKNSNNSIIKISNKLSIFTNLDLIFDSTNKISYEKVNKIINDFKKEYSMILIDTSSEINLKFTKIIFENVDKIIFLVESNLLELKKSKSLLEVYVNDWNINVNKFNLLINKVNKYSIEKEIIKEIFENIKILGEINLKAEYTNYINSCFKVLVNTKQYLNIIKKI